MMGLNENRSLSFKVADHITAMLAYWDTNQVCQYANQAYESWFGKCARDMVGKITMKELLGNLYELNKPYILGALSGKAQTFERIIPSPDGIGERYAIANYIPDIEDGVVLGFFVHVADITSVKKLEASLIDSDIRLQKSFQLIREQNSRLINFTHTVSHNLRTHAGNLESLLLMLEECETDQEKSEIMDMIKQLSGAFSETVTNLNHIADVDSKSHLNRSKINLYDCTYKTLQVLAIDIQTSDSKIVINIPESLEISYNPAYLESILLNLLSNALKYRRDNIPLAIEISTRMEEDFLVLSVIDNGKGINLNKYGHRIFGIYNTFHGNPNAKGIGLFISKYQAQAMGGDLYVDSKENEGSTFSLHIPYEN